jgi:Na+/pantothenate symporter
MPEDKNFFAGLVDFSFQQQLLRRIVKVLYIIGIVAGGITVVVYTVVGFQSSPADGLIALVGGIVSLFAGILIWRGLLELALFVQRIAEGIDRATHSSN